MKKNITINLRPIYEKLGNDIGNHLRIIICDGFYSLADMSSSRFHLIDESCEATVTDILDSGVMVVTEDNDDILFTKEAFKIACPSFVSDWDLF